MASGFQTYLQKGFTIVISDIEGQNANLVDRSMRYQPLDLASRPMGKYAAFDTSKMSKVACVKLPKPSEPTV